MQNEDDFEQEFVSPSFNSYSTDKLADVAAKVCREFDHLNLLEESESDQLGDHKNDNESAADEEEEEEFEFVSFQKSADQVFFDEHQIGPVFPVFNRDLLSDKTQRDLLAGGRDNKKVEEDDDGLPSSSSSDVDELEEVPPGNYCVWMPKAASGEARGKCKKSKSTGTSSSRRWSLRDLLRRSNSEGGKELVFLTPLSSSSKKVEYNKETKKSSGSGTGAASASDVPRKKPSKGPNAVAMAHEAFYVRNKTVAKDGYNKRRSYLPYRQDLVGFFASVNAMGRSFPPAL
ncbi:uncharacterized protein [Pyrus communis]|uniref:uncharacterized protein n=1 Tax=Pyrus communis TaxID=23211 RepID=UPI0035C049AB